MLIVEMCTIFFVLWVKIHPIDSILSKPSTSSLRALSKVEKLIKIGTHNGAFHWDEVFACVMLNNCKASLLNFRAVSHPHGLEEVHEVHRPHPGGHPLSIVLWDTLIIP